MTVKRLSAEFSVSPQIAPDEIPALAAQGFGALICNRPDGEGQGQPPFAEIALAAEANGLKAVYIPMTGPQASPAALKAFEDAWAGLPKPVLGYCRSGMRAAALWSASSAARIATVDRTSPGQGIMGAWRRFSGGT
jgi:sulfide:quinone oxidoreductase